MYMIEKLDKKSNRRKVLFSLNSISIEHNIKTTSTYPYLTTLIENTAELLFIIIYVVFVNGLVVFGSFMTAILLYVI